MSGAILLALRILIALVLYLFFAMSLWLMWQDMRKRGRAISDVRIPALLLASEGDQAQNWRINQAHAVIGRDLACECRIEDATISARHARISFHHGQWWVEDLNSKNGTLLNQRPVLEQVVLTSDDILQCGRVIFRINFDESLNPQVNNLMDKENNNEF